MTYDEIINKAYFERSWWHRKGFTEGKFIIGVEARDVLLSHPQYINAFNAKSDRFMGFPYVIDTEDTMCVNFCPIGD